jgi:hypothetical protein
MADRCLIGLVDGDVGDGEYVETDLADHGTAIAADHHRTLGGDHVVTTGRARVVRPTTEQEIIVGDKTILTETHEGKAEEYVEFVADFDAETPYVALNTSAGTRLWEDLEARHRVSITRAWIDVPAFFEAFADRQGAHVEMTGQSPTDEDTEMAYRGRDVDAVNGDELMMLGFRAQWAGTTIRGVVCESGYVGVYSEVTPATLSAFLREGVLPHCHEVDPDDVDQDTLTTDSGTGGGRHE